MNVPNLFHLNFWGRKTDLNHIKSLIFVPPHPSLNPCMVAHSKLKFMPTILCMLVVSMWRRVHPYIQKHETCTWWGGWENQRNARHHMYHSYVCAESLIWCVCPFCLCYFGLGQRPQKHHLYGGNSHLHEMKSFFHILHQTSRIWLPQQSHSRCHILNWTERQFVSSLNRKRGCDHEV